MKLRLLAVALGLSIVAALMGREGGPGASTRPRARSATSPSPDAPAASALPPEWPEPSRNIFEYGSEVPRAPSLPIATPQAPAPQPTPVPEPPLRLVGLLRHRDGLKAALALRGEVVVLAAGESALGYTLLALDDEGVRLLAPGGEEVVLTLPEG